MSAATGADANKAVVRQILQRADRSDLTLVDDLMAADYLDHNPPPFQGPASGAEGARDGLEAALKIFSDFSHEVVHQFADGDYVITHIRGHGLHTGEFMGIAPTGKDVTMEGIAIHRVVDGKVVEHWGQVDAVGLLAQMGKFG